jgi:periplasmic divalent cation tolerance protein
MPDIVMIYTTWPDAVEAERAGKALVEAGMAACINILPGMVSVYRWEGRVEQAREAIMIIKTVQAKVEAVRDAFVASHPHAVPAFLVVPVSGGLDAYLAWVAQSVDRPA